MQANTGPLEAQAVDGEVVLIDPTGAASVSLTPEAAEATARRLEAAAESARRQGVGAAND